MRSDKKVIILDNIKSDCIEQAMFILKDSRPENIDAVREAERIVENYNKRYHHIMYSKMSKKRRHKWEIAAFIMGSALVLGVICTLWII